MKKHHSLVLSTIAIFAIFTGVHTRADHMASLAITPATGVVTLAPHWAIGGSLAGFHQMRQDLHLGGEANDFYSIKSTTIPSGGDIAAFTFYVAASGAATNHLDIGSKLTPNSYSALTSADPDIGYGSVNFYFIHHKGTTDYFTEIVPGSATSSAVTDLKPMSGPGGPDTITGVSGYFGLTFAAANLGYGLNLFYYLRSDTVTGFTKFGTLQPALLGTSADQFNLGIGGHNALAFTGTDVGYGTDKMYYLRLDPITGFTILGTLHPGTGRTADIANLGSVYSTLTFVPGDLGFGSSQFYTSGAINPTWQSISFAAIADREIRAGSFTVTPSASSALPIALTVVTGSARISAPVAGVFTVTPIAPGLITLQATQAGQLGNYEFNMLRQSFTARGAHHIVISDFDGNGSSEPLWRNTNTGNIRAWFQAGGSVSYGNEGSGWSVIGSGDFDGDGRSEPLWHNASTGDIHTWFLDGGSLTYGTEGGGWSVIGSGDFDGDGRSEPLWRNTNTGDIHAWFLDGSSLSYGTEGGGWSVIGNGDFDGDGRSEPLWRNTNTGDIHVWFVGGGSITFGNEGGGWSITGVGDFDGDGRSEPLWRNASTGDIRVWFLAGGSIPSGNESGGWSVVDVGDYAGDGFSEPLWRNANTGEIRTWFLIGGSIGFGNEGGSWSVVHP